MNLHMLATPSKALRSPRLTLASRLLVVGVICISVAACSGDNQEAAPRQSGIVETPQPTPTETPRPSPQTDTSSPSPAPTATPDAVQQIPAGPYYLPSALPPSWVLTSLRFFSSPPSTQPEPAESVSLVVHQTGEEFSGGGVKLALARFAGHAAERPSGIGFGNPESVEISGLLDAQIEYDVAAGIGSLSAFVDAGTSVSLIGDVPKDELIAIAAAVRVGDGDVLSARVELDGWVGEPSGEPGEIYLMGFRGPEGSLEVMVSPGSTRASLYQGSSDFEAALEGTVGAGYFAVQRVEAEGLEFPRISWWVPSALLSSSVGPGNELAIQILDSFVEIDAAEFRLRVAGTPVEIIETQPVNEQGATGPEAEGVPLEAVQLNTLVQFVEDLVGREFDEPPQVSIIDGSELRESLPDGAFVPAELWDLLHVLGLVTATDNRADADRARRDRVRGVCCPVSLLDTGDPEFNEVVIVHELTHGLDAQLGGTPGSVEVVDPTFALVEGNAHRVAFSYADLLNQQGANIPPPPALFPADGDPRLPNAVQRILEFPYSEGWRFAVAVADQGGEPAIVDAFAKPPTSTEQIMNPAAFLNLNEPANVPPPSVPEGARTRQQGSIGAFLLSLIAEPSVGPDNALELALNWDGDTYILYDLDGQTCYSATFLFDNTDSAGAVADLLTGAGSRAEAQDLNVESTRCIDTP